MIYLDNAATTKPLKEALDFASKYTEDFYNPSALYREGIQLKKFLTDSGEKIARFSSYSGYSCVFTSCGSESDNTAIFSCARRGNAVTTAGEHSAVYEPFTVLKQRGVQTKIAKLNRDGSVNVDSLLSLIDDKTSFVSVVHVNNETGAINDINAIASAVKEINPKTVFHSDGVQAYGKIPFSMNGAVDLYSVSAHKIGAMKGAGAIIKKNGVCLHPLIYGGGQENGLRSGTENVFGIACFLKAAEIKYSAINDNYKRVDALKKTFLNIIGGNMTVLSPENGSPYVISLSAKGLRGEVLQHMLEDKGIIVGTGSACSSRNHFSRILKECGYSSDVLDGVIRISFASETDEQDVISAAKAINECVKTLSSVVLG